MRLRLDTALASVPSILCLNSYSLTLTHHFNLMHT